MRHGVLAGLDQASWPGHDGERYPAPLLLQHGHQGRMTHASRGQTVYSHYHVTTPEWEMKPCYHVNAVLKNHCFSESVKTQQLFLINQLKEQFTLSYQFDK